MSVNGTWTIGFHVPGGDREATMVLREDGQLVTGTYDGVEIRDGRIEGQRLSFGAQLFSPFKVKIKLVATIQDDTITGTAKAAIMTIPFKGTRTSS